MIAPFPPLSVKDRTRRRTTPWMDTQAQTPPAPSQADRTQDRPSAGPVSAPAGQPLRCLWYQAGLADTLAVVDEFLRTPAATAALADFCQIRPSSPASPLEVHTLTGAVALIAARMRP